MPDPLQPGPRSWTRAEYDFGVMVVDDPTLVPYRYTVPLHGSIHLPDGEDAVPVLLFMHGRHGTCAVLGVEGIGTGACPNAMVVTPVTSYTGYDGLAENLASHGYAVVSIDANTINDRDLLGDSGANARGQLVLRTLDEFASVNATGEARGDLEGLPADVPANAPATSLPEGQGRLDLSRVGLMGHSRGGEGVARAVSLDQERNAGAHGIDAVFALAPTDFARWPLEDVVFATLLPYCDGDVSNLQGAWMYDDNRDLPGGPRYQVLAMGANHNFYNTVWTGDDWGTTGEYCGSDDDGSGRDSPEEQRAHGYGLMASFFRLHVGQEQAFAPAWEGRAGWPASLCPKQGTCTDRLLLSRQPPPAMGQVAVRGGNTPLEDGNATTTACSQPIDCTPAMLSVAETTLYEWTQPAMVGWTLDPPAGYTAFTLRVGVPVDGTAVALSVEFQGKAGSSWVDLAGAPQLALPPGGDNAKTVLSMVCVPLPQGWDSSDVDAVLLHFGGSGALHVSDVTLQ